MPKIHKINITTKNVQYRINPHFRKHYIKKSLHVIGIDTEALTTGKCFMICTSEGDTFKENEFPRCMFTRKYRGANFVAYNLKYDSGAFLQHLPQKHLKELQQTDKTEYDGYKYKNIAYKCLTISRKKHAIRFYDMYTFYNTSLEKAAQKYLGYGKFEMSDFNFTPERVKNEWDSISKYCIRDAELVKQLADLLIGKFESYGVYPKKLFSVAYVSWEYFSRNCPYVHVKKYWDNHKPVLDYAMRSYNGGKFEVTTKGPGYYYEYDIVSAYPYEISNLYDIRKGVVIQSKTFRSDTPYGFLKCKIKIPTKLHSPVAVKRATLNYYPCGEFTKVITKNEYIYLTENGADVTIIDAWWVELNELSFPYKHEIKKLMKYKDEYKRTGNKLDYHTIKILLNSLYGKMVQLIPQDNYFKAGAAWNPIYGSVITANARIRITAMQYAYPSIVAVHTDSVLSTKPLDFTKKGRLGDFEYTLEGDGIILGTGIYQIGNKSRFRGFETNKPLIEMIPPKGKKLYTKKFRPYSWREVAHRNMAMEYVNRFTEIVRSLDLNFDTKRIWLDDYTDYNEIFDRNVYSIPWPLIPGNIL